MSSYLLVLGQMEDKLFGSLTNIKKQKHTTLSGIVLKGDKLTAHEDTGGGTLDGAFHWSGETLDFIMSTSSGSSDKDFNFQKKKLNKKVVEKELEKKRLEAK
ncbi:MAG: hypothetical protein GY765_10215 [bacterium]|nr:hypothetical protein [bacterium]